MRRKERYVSASASVEESKYERLKEFCKKRGITVNQFILRCIDRALGEKEEVEPHPLLVALEEAMGEIKKREEFDSILDKVNSLGVKIDDIKEKLDLINKRLEVVERKKRGLLWFLERES